MKAVGTALPLLTRTRRCVGRAGLLCSLVLALLSGCVIEPLPTARPPSTPGRAPAPAPSPASAAAQIEREILQRVNSHRSSSRLAPLTVDDRLSALAREHSLAMARGSRRLGHDGFDDRSARARATVAVVRVSENVARSGYPPDAIGQRTVDSWRNSAGHRRNLDGPYQLTGIGVASVAGGEYYITQLYAGR